MSIRTLLLATLAAVAGFAVAFGAGWALSDRSAEAAAPEAAQPAPIPDPGGIPVKAMLATAAPIPELREPPVVVVPAPSGGGGSATPSTPSTSGGSSAPSTSGGSSAPSTGGGSAPSAPAADPGVFDSQ